MRGGISQITILYISIVGLQHPEETHPVDERDVFCL